MTKGAYGKCYTGGGWSLREERSQSSQIKHLQIIQKRIGMAIYVEVGLR